MSRKKKMKLPRHSEINSSGECVRLEAWKKAFNLKIFHPFRVEDCFQNVNWPLRWNRNVTTFNHNPWSLQLDSHSTIRITPTLSHEPNPWTGVYVTVKLISNTKRGSLSFIHESMKRIASLSSSLHPTMVQHETFWEPRCPGVSW